MSGVVFGKLPAHGDFVARGLTAAARDAIDAWLSVAVAEARVHWGEAFEDRFDRALPWRCTGRDVAGAIAASQDAVGRRFPVLLLGAGDTGQAEACEELLYHAIGEGWSVDRLAGAVAAPADATVERWFGANEDHRDGAVPADLLTAMLA